MVEAGTVATAFIWLSVVLFACLISLVIFGPSQYNAYTTDQIDEIIVSEGDGDQAYGNDAKAQNSTSVRSRKYNSSVTIVVLGDIGRSTYSLPFILKL